jgi:cupin 2 domain-containing protein
MVTMKNIFENIPENISEENIETLLKAKNIRVERIVSRGHTSPKDFWYDQDENEWVILLNGKARLLFDGNNIIELSAGDYINIPAHKKHRVEWSDPQVETVWLAIFY